jgi:hypothetical protein
MVDKGGGLLSAVPDVLRCFAAAVCCSIVFCLGLSLKGWMQSARNAENGRHFVRLASMVQGNGERYNVTLRVTKLPYIMFVTGSSWCRQVVTQHTGCTCNCCIEKHHAMYFQSEAAGAEECSCL